ncbi:MAG: 1-(5-phosphoribosyl)-5-[(5-phosphoribosylamino)methylideneamino]imidazole-4-carboxamide isomerase [Actinomycetota bacterium]|jgi:phosphoribosylformimino-5-aminoimidazole carboxamide ribotide isomerase|nr:1-(5-phosphoribosyl)-5-[(5-phosphoribosylamino)methylideneamino]imidazole-4-carboxamide isomerase [Actinomycetota bacterium]
MELFPAIDVRAGRCVRLRRGDYGDETVYGDDPLAVARGFAEAGTRWIHMVDLDAARTGAAANRAAIATVARCAGVQVQAGGGVRDEAAADALFEVGVARVVVGTAAVEDPGLVARLAAGHPGGVAVGLDARDGEVAVRGWTEGAGVRLLDVVAQFEDCGVAALVVTDISRDGTLSGPDLEGLAAVLASTSIPVVASGGVAGLGDLEALAGLRAGHRGLAGAVVGKALYEGAFSVEEALAALAR